MFIHLFFYKAAATSSTTATPSSSSSSTSSHIDHQLHHASPPNNTSTPMPTPPFTVPSGSSAFPVFFGNNNDAMSFVTAAAAAATTPNNNSTANNIVCPDCVMQAVKVASAIYTGELNQRVTCNHERCIGTTSNIDSNAPINTLKNAINAMASHLQGITDEVMYVAHETAVKGKLGVQARIDSQMAGAWREVVVDLNSMTRNHLEQVRDIADVSTAIARGDLSKAMTVPVKGETLLLKNTFNTMGKKKHCLLLSSLFVCPSLFFHYFILVPKRDMKKI